MSSLRDRLEARGPEHSFLTIRGERFKVLEIPKGERTEIIAAHRDGKGKMLPTLDGALMSRCVRDEDGGEIYSPSEVAKWDELGSGFVGPLMGEVMRLNGLDNDDVGREVKKSETVES